MKRNYFEQDPWDEAVGCVQQQNLGAVAEVSAHATCQKGEIGALLQRWRERLSALLGEEARWAELENGAAVSVLARYQNKAVVRLFFDEAEDGFCENFEIVTKDALLVWKPDTRAQGRELGEEAVFYDCGQPYSFELGMC